MAHQDAIVAVLAGGLGERLGGAKPSVALGGRALICHPLQAAREAGLEAIVVAKTTTTLPPLQVQVVHEPQEPQHPLRGIVTALSFAAALPRSPAVVALACDMPFVTAALLQWLAGLEGPVIAQVDGRAQPLLARLPVESLPLLERALAAERSLQSSLGELSPSIVSDSELTRFGDPARLCFNVNDAAQLHAAGRWLAAAER